MTRGFLRFVPISQLDFEKNRDARWEPRMICQWSSSFALELARLVSPISDSLSLSVRFFLCLPFFSLSHFASALVSPWSVFSRPPPQIFLPRLSSSLHVLVFSSSSSTPSTRLLPPPLPRRFLRRFHLTLTYLYPSTLPSLSLSLSLCCLSVSLFFSSIFSLDFCETT